MRTLVSVISGKQEVHPIISLWKKKKKKKKKNNSRVLILTLVEVIYFLVWVVGRDLRPKNIISLILKRANRYVGRSPRETTRNQNLACLTCDQS